MITILHIITAPCGGGAEILVREFAKQKRIENCEFKVLYFNKKSDCSKKLNFLNHEYFLDVGFRSLRSVFEIRKFIKRELERSPELVVHVHLTWPMLFVPIATIGLDMELYFTEHDTSNGRRKYPFLKYIERLIYSRFKKVICISEGTRKSLEPWIGKNLSQRIEVIPNGSRLFSFKERQPPENCVNFISIGSLFPKKGFDRTIKALASWDSDCSWAYTIIGEGPMRKELEGLISKSGVHDKVKLVGWADDIERHLNEADIQLIPSRFEGFGLVAVEGMSTGLPVIASNVDGLAEVLEEVTASGAAYLVDAPDDESDWHKQFTICFEAIKTTSSFERIAQLSKSHSQKYTLEKMMNGYCKTYKGK